MAARVLPGVGVVGKGEKNNWDCLQLSPNQREPLSCCLDQKQSFSWNFFYQRPVHMSGFLTTFGEEKERKRKEKSTGFHFKER